MDETLAILDLGAVVCYRLELRGPDKLACEGEIPAFEAIRQKGPFGIGPELATRVGDVRLQ